MDEIKVSKTNIIFREDFKEFWSINGISLCLHFDSDDSYDIYIKKFCEQDEQFRIYLLFEIKEISLSLFFLNKKKLTDLIFDAKIYYLLDEDSYSEEPNTFTVYRIERKNIPKKYFDSQKQFFKDFYD